MERIGKAAPPGLAWQPGSEVNSAALMQAGRVPDRDLICAVLRGTICAPDFNAFGLLSAGQSDRRNSPTEPAEAKAADVWQIPARDDVPLWAAFELGRRVGRASPKHGARIRVAGDVADAVAGELNGLQRERVVVLVCDAADQLQATVTVSEGALDRALFPVREILHEVLIHDGRSFAVAHNHPSGDPEPSPADVQATRAIRDAARVVGLRFLGHVVVVAGGWQEVR